ncbi:glycoside hydrolase family 25 protein [Streptomyces sp. NPDC051684]|uniref:glycoside hydrolase family 25 protein n=1 Tax=Streptomyces sp. NPDC051684 TaxID=3365670 RepID=UPI0037911B3B
MATCRGIDVSAYQGTQNWTAHKRDGVAFAFAKASEGQKTHDARFATHIKAIKAAGIVPGAYHFAWPNQDVAREASNYISAVRPYAGRGFTHWLDLERYTDGRNYSGRSASQINAWVARWVALVQEAFPGQRVGIYTSGSDIASGHVPAGLPLWYPAYPWGAAAYSRAEGATQPKPSGRAPLIWQFTSQPIDRSIAYMSAADLRAWAAGTDSEEDPLAGMTKQDIYNAVWKTDAVPAPETSTTIKTNPTWAAVSVLSDIANRVRATEATVNAQAATIKTLAEALAKQDSAVDVDALVQRITTAIESVTVRLDVDDEK